MRVTDDRGAEDTMVPSLAHPQGVIVVGPDRRVESLSPAIAELLGRTVDELAGAPIASLFATLDGAPDALDGPRTVGLRARGGSVVSVLASAVEVVDGRGRPHTALVLGEVAGGPDTEASRLRSRVADLERTLLRIADELQGARVITTPAGGTVPREVETLSAREWEVLRLLLGGYRVPSIARQLRLSPSTVRNHLSAIFRKLDVKSQSELIERMRDYGGD